MRRGTAKVCPKCGEIKPLSDFRDNSLVTGIGRFCLSCKSISIYHRTFTDVTFKVCPDCQNEYRVDSLTGEIKSSCGCGKYTKRLLSSQPTKSDINKLISFTDNPEKYATGTTRTKDKVQYLESIKHKFSEGQLASYESAKEQYDTILATHAEAESLPKKEYGVVIREAFDNHRSVKIRYKGSWRTIDPYSVNATYVVAYCHFARDLRTFRIDRIQGVELLKQFNIDESQQKIAQGRLTEAPRYRGYRKRY